METCSHYDKSKEEKPLLAHLDFLKKSHIFRILLIYFFLLAVFSHASTVPFLFKHWVFGIVCGVLPGDT